MCFGKNLDRGSKMEIFCMLSTYICMKKSIEQRCMVDDDVNSGD
jgi:hypothetical protein